MERIEKLRLSVLELAPYDDLAVPEAFCEDGDGGELVAALVRVVEDDDLRGGGQGSGREGVAEAHANRAAAPGCARPSPANITTTGSGSGGGGVFFRQVHWASVFI